MTLTLFFIVTGGQTMPKRICLHISSEGMGGM